MGIRSGFAGFHAFGDLKCNLAGSNFLLLPSKHSGAFRMPNARTRWIVRIAVRIATRAGPVFQSLDLVTRHRLARASRKRFAEMHWRSDLANLARRTSQKCTRRESAVRSSLTDPDEREKPFDYRTESSDTRTAPLSKLGQLPVASV